MFRLCVFDIFRLYVIANVNLDEPGNEPNITCRNIEEDCSVFGGIFSKGNVSVSRRKRLFSHPDRCKKYVFDKETVYTFEFFQSLFDATTYSLDLGFAKIGCAKVLNGQPIQWLGKMRDGRYLWVSDLVYMIGFEISKLACSFHWVTQFKIMYILSSYLVLSNMARKVAV